MYQSQTCGCGCLWKMSRRWVSEKHSRVRGRPAWDGLYHSFDTQFCATLPGGGLYLHKLFAWREFGFYLHKHLIRLLFAVKMENGDFQSRPLNYWLVRSFFKFRVGAILRKLRRSKRTIEFTIWALFLLEWSHEWCPFSNCKLELTLISSCCNAFCNLKRTKTKWIC